MSPGERKAGIAGLAEEADGRTIRDTQGTVTFYEAEEHWSRTQMNHGAEERKEV